MGRGRALKAGGAEDGAASGSVKMGRGRALTSAEGAAAENAARERLRKNAAWERLRKNAAWERRWEAEGAGQEESN